MCRYDKLCRIYGSNVHSIVKKPQQFFKSTHCKTNLHCNTCRDKEGGRAWRASLVGKFKDIDDVDFKCPVNYKWGAEITLGRKDRWKELFSEIGLVSGEGVAVLWLKSMAAQLQELRKHPPRHVKCKTRSAHNTRCLKRLEYYYEKYKGMKHEEVAA